MDHDRELQLAMETARTAGDFLRSSQARDLGILSSKGRDIKLEADHEAQTIILRGLASHSDYPILAEEMEEGDRNRPMDSPLWIVDPLDGSLNFSRGIPFSAVSIALWKGDQALLGVVYDFNHNEMFRGLVGKGAWGKEENPLIVSTISEPSQATLATGFPVARSFSPQSIAASIERSRQFKKLRLFGSAALSLAYVASGRVDAYMEEDVMLWDVAAGIALVEAAGGHVKIDSSSQVAWAVTVRGAGQSLLCDHMVS